MTASFYRHHAEVIGIHLEDPIDVEVVALINLLAESMVVQFGDAVGVLHLGSRPSSFPATQARHRWIERTELESALRAWSGMGTVFVEGDEAVCSRVLRLGFRGANQLVLDTSTVGPSEVSEYGQITPLSRLCLDAAARQQLREGTVLSSLSAPFRAGVDRWARAVSGRRLGLALGGAGVWGMGAIALLQGLEARAVPVDLIAGASSGAIVGAYYAAEGATGLTRLLESGPRFERQMGRMFVDTRAAERIVDADLGQRQLQHLELPLLPVVSDLALGFPGVVTAGTLGFGVRASVSAPGVFPALHHRTKKYVDGAVCDNAPFRPVEAAGADLVLVANFLPAPLSAPPSRIPNPFRRILDFEQAFAALLHRSGNIEPTPGRLLYRASPARFPLRQTFRYGAARHYYEIARRDENLGEAIAQTEAAWRRLAAPRGTLPEST